MRITKFNNPKFNPRHPFKRGIKSILDQHFAPSIADRFDLILEVERYNLDPSRTKGLINQKNDDRFVCEVYYKNPSGLLEYITDVCSWWDRDQVEYVLLKFITDKAKTGAIGKDWDEKDIRISQDIKSGKFETPDSEITKDMVREEVSDNGI